jgi:hypothetical protein
MSEESVVDGLVYQRAKDDSRILCGVIDKSIAKVVIRSDVCEIKEMCFYGCRYLREVIFESGSRLQRIGESAFSYTGLKAIIIPSSVEVIDKCCFCSCGFLSEVTFEPKSKLKQIEDHAFESTALKKAIIPSSVEVIGECCFWSCQSLREISFEKDSKLREMGDCALKKTEIERFEIPSKCQLLNGLSLRDVQFVTVSKENPFFAVEGPFLMSYDRKRLIRFLGREEHVVVKKEVEVIEENCFCGCEFLCEVIFEKGSRLRLIKHDAFRWTGLTTVILPSSVEVLEKECFAACPSLREVIFEEGSELKEIKSWAFGGTKVSRLEIPSKCQFLNGCSLRDVKPFTISKENPFLVIEESFLKSSDRKRLIWYMGREKQVVVKKEVEVIGERCFALSDVCELIFEKPSRVRQLEKKAFCRCYDLTKVVIPASVEVIGEKCFLSCSHLGEVVYEGEVASIAENAFSRCPL